MCLICIDYVKGNLTVKEAFKNLNEVEPTTAEEFEHQYELYNILMNEDEDE